MHTSPSNSTAHLPDPAQVLAFNPLSPNPSSSIRTGPYWLSWLLSWSRILVSRPRTTTLLSLVLFSLPIWVSLGDHGFNGRSDARYAVVAQHMVASNDWLVPSYMGHMHLTKPPLVYWLEGVSIELLGNTYLAVRLPSAIAGTLTLLLLYWFMHRLYGRRAAIFTCGIYAIMPMTIFPARMTVTDSVLNLCWTMTLIGAYLSSQLPQSRRIGFVMLWAGSALGMLTKGPVMFIPIGVVITWWAITRTGPYSWKRTLIFSLAGLSAMLPALLWAISVLMTQPEAARIWWHETFDRAIGQGDHAKPIWFFIPVLLVGCFPCSAMLLLPGVNLRLSDSWKRLRNSSLEGFLGYAIISTFVVYSLISGKLPSYLLPVCAPLSMVCALVLERWFTEQRPAMPPGCRLPEVRVGMLLGTCIYAIAAGGALTWYFGTDTGVLALGLAPAILVALLMVRFWSVLPLRMPLTAAFIVSWIMGWLVLLEVEDIALGQVSYGVVARATFGQQGWQGRVGAYQLESGIIYWEREGELEQFANPSQLAASVGPSPILVLTRKDRWDELNKADPSLHARGRIVHDWRQFPGAPTRYLVVFDATAAE